MTNSRRPRRRPCPAVRAAVARAAVEAVEPRLMFATYAVTSVADAGPGTLRQAILDANANIGPDAIWFDIAAAGVATIVPATALPAIADAVTVDATTQPGYAGSPRVELIGPGKYGATGWGSGGVRTGLDVTGDDVVIRGLAIDGFGRQVILGGSRGQVAGCHLGVDAAGVDRIDTEHIESSFGSAGVETAGADNLVGGTAAGDRNVISGNSVGVLANGLRWTVAGNYIGLDPTGTAARGNTSGVRPGGTLGTIGGATAAARNVIAGNWSDGVGRNYDGFAVDLAIRGNYVGTDAAGTASVRNAPHLSTGIALTEYNGGGTGTTTIADNVIAGEMCPIDLSFVTDVVIVGNRIGVAADGSPLGNERGVFLHTTTNVRVGGHTAAEANWIANNGLDGIRVTSYGFEAPGHASGNAILGNRIEVAAGKPVSLRQLGASSQAYQGRDHLDADAGPNEYQNYPLLESFDPATSTVRVNVHGVPNETVRVELFAGPRFAAGGPSEVRQLVAAVGLTTDAAGRVVADVPVSGVPEGWHLMATSTNPRGNTSEFSPSLVVRMTPPLPTPAAPDLVAASDSGLFDNDNVTKEAVPTFTGVAEPGATVTLLVGDARTPAGKAVADASGNYRVTASLPFIGEAIQVRVEQALGNRASAPGAALIMTVDGVAPTLTLSPAPRASEYEDVPYVRILGNEPLYGVGRGDFFLASNGADLPLGAGSEPVMVTSREYRVDVSAQTAAGGTFVARMVAGAVTDLAGNASALSTGYFVKRPIPAVAIFVTRAVATEGGAPASFQVFRTGMIDVPLVVDLTWTGATGDVGPRPASVTVPAGSQSVTFEVAAVADAVYDPGEGFAVALAASGRYTVNALAVSASATIVDALPDVTATWDALVRADDLVPVDALTVRFNRPVTIPAGALVLTRGSTEVPLGAAQTPTTTDGGRTWTVAGLDPLTYRSGNYVLALRRVVEQTGTTVELAASGVGFKMGDRVKVAIVATPTTVAEGGAPSSFRVTRTGPTYDPLVVDLSWTGATGDAGPRPASVTIPAGASDVTFEVAVLADDVYEPSENFTAWVTDRPWYARDLAAYYATVKIDDALPPVTGRFDPFSRANSTVLIGPLTVRFNRPVTIPAGGFALTRDGVDVPLAPAQDPTASDGGLAWTFGDLAAVSAEPGLYVLWVRKVVEQTGTTVTLSSTTLSFRVATPNAVAIAAGPTTGGSVTSAVVTFARPVSSFDIHDLVLTRDGGPNLLTSAQSLSSADGMRFTLNGLEPFAFRSGAYRLRLAASTTIYDPAAGWISPAAETTWTVVLPSVSAAIDPPAQAVPTDPVDALTVRFNRPVDLEAGDLFLSRGGGSGLALSGLSLASPDGGTTWTVGGLAPFTAPAGTYTFRVLTVTDRGGVEAAVHQHVYFTVEPRTAAFLTTAQPEQPTGRVDAVGVVFTRDVTGFDAGDLTLTRDGGPNLLPATHGVTALYGSGFNVSGLAALNTLPGTYRLRLAAATATINDGVGGRMAADAEVTWTVVPPPLPAVSATIELAPRAKPTDAVDWAAFKFNQPVTLAHADIELRRDGALVPGFDSLTLSPSEDRATWTIQGLSLRTGQPGDYTLRLRTATDSAGKVVDAPAVATFTVAADTPIPNLIRADSDYYVRDGSYANANYGLSTALEVRQSGTSGQTRQAYLHFPIGGIAYPDQIKSAKLRLYGKLSSAGSVPLGLYPVVTSGPGETSVKWATRPSAASSTPVATKTVTATGYAWYEFDVTALVKSERKLGRVMAAFNVRGTAASTPWFTFNSDEASANRPELRLEQVPQAIVVSSATATVAEGKTASVTVKLATRPASAVTVAVARAAGDGDLTAGPLVLTFTPDNWSTAQTVTLSAAQDADAASGTATFAFSAAGLAAKTLTATESDDDQIRAVADGYARDGSYAATKYGAATVLEAGKSATAGGTREAFLRFDLSNAAATVGSAKLRLYGKASGSATAGVALQVFGSTNLTWSESTAAWATRPAAAGPAVGSLKVVGTTAKWYEVDLTAYVKAERAAGRKVVTLVLKGMAANALLASFNGDEASANRPVLVVAG